MKRRALTLPAGDRRERQTCGLYGCGSAAYTTLRPPPTPTGRTLTRIDSTGMPDLDSGLAIDPTSLGTDGRHLNWQHDGQPRVIPFS